MTIHQSSFLQKMLLAVAALAGAALLALGLEGCGGAPPGAGNAANDPAAGAATQAASPSATTAPAAPSPGTTSTNHTKHAHCGWIGADTAEAGVASFQANPDYFDAIHPKWWTLNPDGSPKSIAFTDDKRVIETAQAHHVKLIPLIDSDSASYLRTIMSSPANIQTHVQQLVNVVEQHGYDGIELDYEHLWSKSDRAPYVSLVQQVAAAMHAKGKMVTLALPAMDHDDGNNAYDYAQLNAAVDVMHLMGYDYHYFGGDHLGPLAPKGWIQAVTERVATIGDPSKYVLGVANYAISSGWYGSVTDAIAKCGGNYAATTDHMNSCPYGHPEAGRAPNCNGIWFEDAGSVGEKAALAKQSGLGGIGYWTVGSEPNGFFDAITAQYPANK